MPSPMMESPRVLAVRFGALGDLVLTTPLFRAIRRTHPKARITLVTRREYTPLFSQNPHIAEVIGYGTGEPLAPLARRLRAERWTHRLDLHGSLRSRAFRILVGGRWRGYPKHRLARHILVRFKRDLYRDRRHVVERYFDAARGLEVSPDGKPPEVFVHHESAREAERLLHASGLGRPRSLVAVVPGSAHMTKRWPERLWHELIRLLVAAERDVVVLGGVEERELGSRLAESGDGRAVSAAGRFDVQGTAALLRHARAAVAGDTGVMHLATAVGTPVVVMLGPTVPQFGFLPYAGRSTVVERALACRPCSAHGGPRCPLGHHRCLESITPGEILEAVRRFPQ